MKKIYSSPPTGKAAPQRTCAACRRVKDKKALIRLVRTPEGSVEIDTTGKKDGRGAYLCKDAACWDKLAKGKQLENALKSAVNKKDLEQLIKNGKALLKE